MKRRWTHIRNALFLLATAAVVAVELLHAFDEDPGTRPWTSYLIAAPLWVVTPLSIGFGVWLVWHLLDARRRERDDRGEP
jgi:hypothetical protein